MRSSALTSRACNQPSLDYFPDLPVSKYDWIRNPFQVELSDLPDDITEELVELKHDRTMKIRFSPDALTDFWIRVGDCYPKCSKEALAVLVQFGTSYLCESGFSAMVAIKTRYRGRLDITADMRCALSTTAPNMEKLCASVQAQGSH